jgi:hypothetical protein
LLLTDPIDNHDMLPKMATSCEAYRAKVRGAGDVPCLRLALLGGGAAHCTSRAGLRRRRPVTPLLDASNDVRTLLSVRIAARAGSASSVTCAGGPVGRQAISGGAHADDQRMDPGAPVPRCPVLGATTYAVAARDIDDFEGGPRVESGQAVARERVAAPQIDG